MAAAAAEADNRYSFKGNTCCVSLIAQAFQHSTRFLISMSDSSVMLVIGLGFDAKSLALMTTPFVIVSESDGRKRFGRQLNNSKTIRDKP